MRCAGSTKTSCSIGGRHGTLEGVLDPRFVRTQAETLCLYLQIGATDAAVPLPSLGAEGACGERERPKSVDTGMSFPP
jgi:hypothetical protein